MDNSSVFDIQAERQSVQTDEQPVAVLFLIRSLHYGGAERQLTELVCGMDKQRFAITVATFYDGGDLRSKIERLENVRVVSLHKRHRWDVLPFLWRLARLVWQVRPQIMHGYMDVANELSLLLGKAVGAKAVWGIRNSDLDVSQYNWAVRATFYSGACLSHFADLIIVNSHAGLHHHVVNGYTKDTMIVIPNGINIDHFKPNPVIGSALRHQWGIGDDTILIGQVSRLDPMKGHFTFLEAAARMAKIRPDIRFVCVGDGSPAYTQALHRKSQELGLEQRLIWSGATTQPVAVYNALTIATLASSYGEGFANVVGEAMACGIPCIVTDVGDSAWIVQQPMCVVPPNDPAALVDRWLHVLDLSPEERQALGRQARQRVAQHFSTQQLTTATEAWLKGLLT